MAEGATFGILGALSAFPRRLAAREVARQGGALRGAAARNLTHIVFGRPLLDRMSAEELKARADKARRSGATPLSESGFRRELGLIRRAQDATVSRASLIEQSKLGGRIIDMLSLFDAFEQDSEPYAFRDVILGRKYEKLIASGTSWADIARSVHRVGKVASLTALALHGNRSGVYRQDGDRLSEIDGQGLLPFAEDDGHDADELFAAAEAAEQNGDCGEAADLYQRYLTLVPGDPVAAFNRANALRAAARHEDAAAAYAFAIKLDPRFAEAWFNYGSLLRESGKRETARMHFARAMALDASYADPVYSLAALEYDAGELAEARRHWVRYLELDPKSDWAKKATRGIQLIDMTLNAERKRGA
jgi:tetratricopeptide (TPR) repeat protein